MHGASIAVNGVCLTVVEHGDGEFTADVMQETLDRSSLGALVGRVAGQPRAPGHARRRGSADTSSRATSTAPARSSTRTPSEHWEVVRVSLPDDLGRYVVEKGSVTVDGVSLTVVEAAATTGSRVSLIPTTLELTTLGAKGVGDPVNLEVDVVAKYVERMLQWRTS